MLSDEQKANVLDSVQLAKAVLAAKKANQFEGMMPDLQIDVCRALVDMTDEVLAFSDVSIAIADFGSVGAKT